MFSEEYIFINEIIDEHEDRMQNLKKYYPFFRLREISLEQYKDGVYSYMDMSYILLAILRLLIEENNFNDTGVSFGKYSRFTTHIIKKTYDLYLEDKENKELINHIFDKIKNDGKPFIFTYYEPKEKKTKQSRVKLIESKVVDGKIQYFITSDAIEFYLDTKEIKDESKISIQQILLSKIIESNNYKGGVDVVRRINNEVSKLIFKKNEILTILSYNVFEGMKSYNEFFNNSMKWFDEEQRLFEKNRKLIEIARQKIEDDFRNNFENDTTIKNREDIYNLEVEMKKAILKHSELLNSCTDLKVKSDTIIKNATLNKLKVTFDFKNALDKIIAKDDIRLLDKLVSPLYKVKLNKSLNLRRIDDLLTYKANETEEAEEIIHEEEKKYRFIDEIIDERIKSNFISLVRVLLECVYNHKEFDLYEYNRVLIMTYNDIVLKNSDYYSFLIHLSQKREYDISKVIQNQDTIFDNIITEIINKDYYDRYKDLKFNLKPIPEEEIVISDMFKITNIRFERIG